MNESKYFALLTMVGMSPWIGEITTSDYEAWCQGLNRTVPVSKPRSFQMKVIGQNMELHIGPVYPMFTKQLKLVTIPSAIELLGDIEGEGVDATCPDNSKLYHDYSEAVDMWYKQLSAESSGIVLAKPGDIPNLSRVK